VKRNDVAERFGHPIKNNARHTFSFRQRLRAPSNE
jgi:hypothetical protein